MAIYKNKKAGEKYLSVWWIFMIIILLTGVVVSVRMLAFVELDTKKTESEVLTNKIIDCLVKNGQINQDFLSGSKWLTSCGINENIIRSEGIFFIKLELYNIESCKKTTGIECGNPIKSETYGDLSLEKNCLIKTSVQSARNFPSCTEQYIYVLSNDKEMILHINTGSNQVGNRA